MSERMCITFIDVTGPEPVTSPVLYTQWFGWPSSICSAIVLLEKLNKLSTPAIALEAMAQLINSRSNNCEHAIPNEVCYEAKPFRGRSDGTKLSGTRVWPCRSVDKAVRLTDQTDTNYGLYVVAMGDLTSSNGTREFVMGRYNGDRWLTPEEVSSEYQDALSTPCFLYDLQWYLKTAHTLGWLIEYDLTGYNLTDYELIGYECRVFVNSDTKPDIFTVNITS